MRLLGHAIQHGSLLVVELLDAHAAFDVSPNSGALREGFHIILQRSNRTQVIEHRRSQLARELMHQVHALFEQVLRVIHLFSKRLIRATMRAQHRDAHVRCRQYLAYLVVQLPADVLSLFLLHGQHSAGEESEILLHRARFREQANIMLATLSQRQFGCLPFADIADHAREETPRTGPPARERELERKFRSVAMQADRLNGSLEMPPARRLSPCIPT